MRTTLQFLASLIALLALAAMPAHAANYANGSHHYLYVTEPGVRDYLEYGGHGVIVFDMDNDHKFVKRIPSAGVDAKGKPINVKGVCVSIPLKRIYITTTNTMMALDLVTEKLLWEKPYEAGCDRMAISPDGKTIYIPSFENDHWHVVDAATGEVIKKIVLKSGSHNTIYGLSGDHAYLAGLKSPLLTVTDTKDHSVWKTVGPFGSAIRPLTVNAAETLVYVNVNGLLGFEIGDIKTGQKLHRVEVQNYEIGAVKRHGCPSHGIGLTPDETEIWLCDAHNSMLHIFDNKVMPPKQTGGIKLRDEPGWITFSLDGHYAYPSTGEIIETATRKIVTQLKDEEGRLVQSEKVVEIHFDGNQPVKAGDQFGVGRKGK